MVFISKKLGLKILIEPFKYHFSEKGKEVMSRPRYIKFNSGQAEVPDTDLAAIKLCKEHPDVKLFEDCDKVLAEDGTATAIILSDDDYIGRKEAAAMIGGMKELKKRILLGELKEIHTTGGDKFKLSEINDYIAQTRGYEK